MEATDANMKIWEKQKEKHAKEREKIIEAAKELAQKIEKVSLTITVQVGDNGKLFGSVTNTSIAKALEENGFTVEKHDILLAEPLKEAGVFTVEIRLHPEVIAKAKVWVVEEKKIEEEKVEEETKPE
jgi:large subunit ribosomal protein L9